MKYTPFQYRNFILIAGMVFFFTMIYLLTPRLNFLYSKTTSPTLITQPSFSEETYDINLSGLWKFSSLELTITSVENSNGSNYLISSFIDVTSGKPASVKLFVSGKSATSYIAAVSYHPKIGSPAVLDTSSLTDLAGKRIKVLYLYDVPESLSAGFCFDNSYLCALKDIYDVNRDNILNFNSSHIFNNNIVLPVLTIYEV